MEADSGAAKPVADLADVLLVRVVEMPTGGEYLDCLRTTGQELVQQSGMQPFTTRVEQS